MARMTCIVGLSEDQQQVVLELREDDVALAHILLDGADAERVAKSIGDARASLPESVPDELDPGARVETINAPAWKVPDTHNGPSGKLLALRHPGLGWLGFLLEDERARAIAKALSEERSS